MTLRFNCDILILLKSGDIMQIKINEKLIEVENNLSVREIIKNFLSEEFAECLACKINGNLTDLSTIANKNDEITTVNFNDIEGKNVFWHTTSHILAYAVKNLYPNAKLAMGPAVEEGFYYDFDLDEQMSLEEIEKEMRDIIKKNHKVYKKVVSKKEALQIFKNEPYKIEIIKGIPSDEIISYYQIGDFIDLCKGPHLYDLSKIKEIKLNSITSAYWKGDSKNKSLKRINGISFRTKEQMQNYEEILEDRQKYNHNKLGREMGIFMTDEVIGQGLPLFPAKGAKLLQLLQRFVEDQEEKHGYLITKTPIMAKNDLYKISGHWDLYKDKMFIVNNDENENETLALRPMTCPFQFAIYNSGIKSINDLPIKYAETATLFRKENSGEMHGLIRIRQFTLSDGHIICAPEQLEEEFKRTLEFVNLMMRATGLINEVTYRLSYWDPEHPDKYINNPDAWEKTQKTLKKIVDKIGLEYVEAKGEAAFYGPKLDIQAKNIYGKEDTLFTLQIDFVLAERFKMTYVDSDGKKKMPYIIHRSAVGCYERTLALMIEKLKGNFPVWLCPVQVAILPISEKFMPYVKELKEKFASQGIRASVDTRNEKIGNKIRVAQVEKIPFMIVIGEKEVSENILSVRERGGSNSETYTFTDFMKLIKERIENFK